MLRGVVPECLPHTKYRLREGDDLEKFRAGKNRPRKGELREPCLRIGQRAEAQLRARPQVIHGLGDQRKLRLQRGNILVRCERRYGPAPGRAGGEAAHDLFEGIEFQQFFNRD